MMTYRGLFPAAALPLIAACAHAKKEGRALFCSEAVVRTMQAAGYPRSEQLDAEVTTPVQLFEFLRRDQGSTIHEREALIL